MQTHTYLAVKSMFFKISVVLVIIGFGKKRNIKFFVLCAEVAICVCLLVVCGSLWSFAVGLWLFVVVCDHLLVVCGRLLVVCGRLWSLPVLVTTLTDVYCIIFYKEVYNL